MLKLPEMMDLNARLEGLQTIEITIRKDGKVVWINANGLCVFRACEINGHIIIHDERETATGSNG